MNICRLSVTLHQPVFSVLVVFPAQLLHYTIKPTHVALGHYTTFLLVQRSFDCLQYRKPTPMDLISVTRTLLGVLGTLDKRQIAYRKSAEQTSCYSTLSERPYRYCHLASKVETIDRTPDITYANNGLGDAAKHCLSPWGHP